MSTLTDIVALFDWPDRLEGIISRFVTGADWKRAYRRDGLLGLASEGLSAAAGECHWTIRIPRDAGMSGGEIEQMLRSWYIPVFGRWFEMGDPGNICFSVPMRQANWAEYLLCRRGIPIAGQMFNAHNARATEKYQGVMPTRWKGKRPVSSRRDWLDEILEMFT